jgi:dolichol-phosphate mannosyltransferase
MKLEDQDAGQQAGEPELCIVVPAYNEAENLPRLIQAVDAALDCVGIQHTYLIVDDGSVDGTPVVLERLAEHNAAVGYVRLARNFGLQAALTAGLRHAPGRAVVVMDADLQDDPAALPDMIEKWRAGAKVVYAIRTERQENMVRRVLTAAFYWMSNSLAEIPIPHNAGSFALYDRRVVEEIKALPEANRYLPGLRAWVGFEQVGVAVPRAKRHAGRPTQSKRRLLSLALDGMLSFSKAPLRAASLLGFVVMAGSGLGLLIIAYWRFIQRSFPAGVGLATIALALLFLGGVQLLVLGTIGEYVGRVYDEVKRRPHFVVAAHKPPRVSASRHRSSLP